MSDTFSVPPSPNWFNSQILACAPDNTLIYGSKNEVVVVHPGSKDETSKIEILPEDGCNQRVVSVDVSPKWDSPNKWVLCSWVDNIVKIWDVKKCQWKKCSPPSKIEKDSLRGARFFNSENQILSVTEYGSIVICHLPQLKFIQLADIFQAKVTVTCFAPCPHSSYMAAFGFKNGLIMVVDIRKNGSVVHKLRGHTSEVTSLSWCPSPMNIFPQKPGNRIKFHQEEQTAVGNLDLKNAYEIEASGSIGKTYEEPMNLQKDSPQEIKSAESSRSDNERNSSVESDQISDKQKTQEAVEPSREEVSTKLLVIPSEQNESLVPLRGEKLIEEELNQELGSTNEEHSKPDADKEEPECDEKNSIKEELPTTHDEEKSSELTKPIEEESETIEKTEDATSPKEPIEEEPKKEMLPPTAKDGDLLSTHEEEKLTEVVESVGKEEMPKTHVDTVETAAPLKQRVEEDPKKEMLLASSAKDGYVNIWTAGTDGRLQCFFKIDDKKGFSRDKKTPSSLWIAIKWITPFSLLVSNKKGEILKYILPKPMGKKLGYRLVHNEHTKVVFAIAAYVPILSEQNWFVENEITIWSFSHDLFLLNTVLDTKITHLSSIETFCALVNYMTYSPVDPNRIALGLSNGTIKIWNSNNSSPQFFSTANYNPRIYGKITNLAWHPANELMIAFTTEEGAVGLININNKKKATWFKQYFSSTVHRIQWAPYAKKTYLYAIAKGTLACFNPDQPNEEPIKIELSSNDIPYYFAWKMDMSIMLLSYFCGKITLYDQSLNLKASYFNNKKLSIMQWHPESIDSTNHRSFWVASAIDNVVYVYDFAEIKEKNGTLNYGDVVKIKISKHFGNVRCIDWNPNAADQLVTAGEDGLSFVLDVSNGSVISSYYDDRFQPIKAIMWSPTQEDLVIITLTRLAMLMGWKRTDYQGDLPEEIIKECQNHKHSKKNNVPQKDDDMAKKVKSIKKKSKGALLPNFSAGTTETEDKLKIMKYLLEQNENEQSIETSNFEKLFGTKDEVLSLLNMSESTLMSKSKFDAAATVSVFKGDLKKHISEAIEQYAVTPLLISLAPSVSLSLWQKACDSYANQLVGKPDADPLEVATYFLACQNIKKAIDYLCEKEMFKEALALARSRLPADSVIFDDIVTKWAQFSSYCGNLEIGALCLMKLGKFEDAVKMLFRRDDVNVLSFALELARKTGNPDLIKAVEFRLKAFSENNTSEMKENDEMIGKMYIEKENNGVIEDENVDINEVFTDTEEKENSFDKPTIFYMDKEIVFKRPPCYGESSSTPEGKLT